MYVVANRNPSTIPLIKVLEFRKDFLSLKNTNKSIEIAAIKVLMNTR
jgi:hypothetical protein